ncbi:MAG TPA: hypothetical protein VNL16_13950 [Chloroflexota bacterium]|nr:hypothetical protein [Chloroflexota bacterium]
MLLGRSKVVIIVIALLLSLAACNALALEQSISMESVYPSARQTEVTIHYTVPPPPPGKVYVLWVLNPADHDTVDVGQVPGGRDLTARATVNFEATGAIVSIEDQPNPARMSDTWALKVGSVTPETPTPSVGVPAGAATPNAGGTPNTG